MTKKKMPEILNLHGAAHGEMVAICWSGEGYRHHFWYGDLVEANHRAQIDGLPLDLPIYRNLPLGHPDVFRRNTRTLDSAKGYAKACLDVIFPQVPALYGKAAAERDMEKFRQAEARREAERKEARRLALLENVPALLEAAKEVVAAWESGDLAAAVRELAATINEIEE